MFATCLRHHVCDILFVSRWASLYGTLLRQLDVALLCPWRCLDVALLCPWRYSWMLLFVLLERGYKLRDDILGISLMVLFFLPHLPPPLSLFPLSPHSPSLSSPYLSSPYLLSSRLVVWICIVHTW